MNLIPLGSRTAIVPIMGKAQKEAAAAELTARVIAALQFLLEEDEDEYLEVDNNSDGEEESDRSEAEGDDTLDDE